MIDGVTFSFEELRKIWRNNFTLPADNSSWLLFAFSWLWALAGVVPGAVAAAIIISALQITTQPWLNIVAIAVAFIGMTIVPFVVIALAFLGLGFFTFMGKVIFPEKLSDNPRVQDLWRIPLVILNVLFVVSLIATFLAPISVAGWAAVWYFTSASVQQTTAAFGGSRAVLLKVFIILFGVVVWPAITGAAKSFFQSKFWTWLMRE